MRIRGLGRQCECLIQKWRPRHKHGKGLSHVEYYHLRRPRRARAVHKGRRPRRDDRRGPLGHLRLRRRRGRGLGVVRRPVRQMRLRVGRHRVRPAEEAVLDGNRLRRRRGVQDDQAQRRQAEEERPQRRGVPGAHAVGGQRRGGVGPPTTGARRRATWCARWTTPART